MPRHLKHMLNYGNWDVFHFFEVFLADLELRKALGNLD
jgi:hypothetical protein